MFQKQGKSLLRKMTNPDDGSNDEWEEIKSSFRQDDVGKYILNDDTLCSWGSSLTIKLGSQQGKHIRDRLRTVGTFCTKYRQVYGTENTSVIDILQTRNIQKIYTLAKDGMAFGEALTPPVRLGSYIKDIITLLKQNAIFSHDLEKKRELEDLLFIVENKWTLISAPNTRKLKELKPTVVEMPLTNDIKLFLQFLSDAIAENVKELKEIKTMDSWMKLSKNVLAFLIVFNRRREGEVSKVELKTYTEKPNYDSMETDTIVKSLSATEQYLCRNYSYMSTVGKRNQRVPIVYPQLIEDALKSLVENREMVGIHKNNKFLFANSVLSHHRGSKELNDLVGKCNGLQKPHLMKSTKLRKHVATVAQILVLNGDELGHLSNHLGHSEAVHKEFYRQQESVIEKTHITKMLELVNTGNIAKFKGKTLNDVTLEDLISAATEDVNNEPIDEDEELDDDVNLINIEHGTCTPNVSKDNEVVSMPSSSTSNPSLQVKPKVTLNPTPHVNTKRSRKHWSKSIKAAIKLELGDCITTIGNLTPARATAFLEKYNLQGRGFLKLKHVINNMGRKK